MPPLNEWPDPQFCIQDANEIVTSMDNELTGPIAPILVSSYTTGSSSVTAHTTNTQELAVGNLIYFNAAADPALQKSALKVSGVVANTSFSFTLEYKDGLPSASAGCEAIIMQRGDTTGAAGGAITTNVSKSVSTTKVWISDRNAHTSLLHGCKRVMVVQKSTANAEVIFWQANAARLSTLVNVPRAVGLAAYVANGTGATAQAWINNGGTVTVGSGSATMAARTWLSNSATPSSIQYYYAGVELTGPVGSTFVIGEFTECASAAALADGSFSTPRAQIVTVAASVSPWVSANLTTPSSVGPDGTTFSFPVNLRQASWGVINEGVSFCLALFEGQSDTVGNLLAWRCEQTAPTTFSFVNRAPAAAPSVFTAPVSADYGFTGGNLYLDNNAGCVGYSISTSNKWGFCSFDIGAFVLFGST